MKRNKKPIARLRMIDRFFDLDHTASAGNEIEFALLKSVTPTSPIFMLGNGKMPSEIVNGIEIGKINIL